MKSILDNRPELAKEVNKIFIINLVLFQFFIGQEALYCLVINSFYFHSYHLLLLYA